MFKIQIQAVIQIFDIYSNFISAPIWSVVTF